MTERSLTDVLQEQRAKKTPGRRAYRHRRRARCVRCLRVATYRVAARRGERLRDQHCTCGGRVRVLNWAGWSRAIAAVSTETLEKVINEERAAQGKPPVESLVVGKVHQVSSSSSSSSSNSRGRCRQCDQTLSDCLEGSVKCCSQCTHAIRHE